MERLTEKDWKDKCAGYPWNVHPVKDIDDLPYYKKLAAYEDAEEQGLLIRLPCKVGDTVYAFLSTCNYFTECQINKIELKPTLYGNTCYFLEPIGHRGCLYRCFENEFGKTIFLKKEEAEVKLKELKGGENENNY